VLGKRFYLTTENDEETFKGTVTATGSLTDLKLFAETGGETVVPEWPIDLVFGGTDQRTLYILTHHSIYAVKTEAAGLRYARR
jgi:sugar lactone lactonase YvrE